MAPLPPLATMGTKGKVLGACLLAPVAPKECFLMVLHVLIAMSGVEHGQMVVCGHWRAQQGGSTPGPCVTTMVDAAKAAGDPKPQWYPKEAPRG